MDKNHRTYDTASSVLNPYQQRPPPPSVDDQQALQYCLYQVQKLHGGSPKMARELELVLPSIMNDCVVSNIEAGKNWIFKNCQRPDQCQAVLDYINALAKMSPHFSHRLHLLYLINDVLHHAVARQMIWMKNALLSRLSTLLSLGYLCRTDRSVPDQQAKITKLINIWEEKQFFDSATVHKLRQEINNELPNPAYGQPHSEPTSLTNMAAPQGERTSSKPYYELPAGLMTVALKVDQPPYTPIDPLAVRERPSQHRQSPSKEMLNAVDTFYAGLNIKHLKPLSATVGNDATVTVGWESGYLDKFYKKFQATLQQRMKMTPSQPSQHYHHQLETRRDHGNHDHDYHRRRKSSMSRGRSPTHRDRSPRRRESSTERRKSRYGGWLEGVDGAMAKKKK
ncbi:hypothetical protein BCR42DRAFT_409864 [Absidia repens]|uniref:CID domain-containing protein n=1 Tax=Absidia repens TaxID=90262 RepID=A0A1X2IN88_9FUNG|nr:hypothetical protein BCR42DRAFT_409864 [Absidia repens]